ncbi:ras GTPase-activating protein [Dendrothele bispora CBS 962.96]|uniref:Ras GTPase-activating protein n=1 Tax=Dendrothele bispora (strain CBS 962.96) TaxID=1314807 RepID=A0A4S8MZ28_DENBC|nr:ras GTPase-activating protein [Dendrothele bispora CBS 962.96]
MNRSDSASSNNSASSSKPPGAFAYQTRLLERTSSVSKGASLSRSNSQMSILTNPTGSSSSSSATPRRWLPSHRVTNSLDAVRGKWEERVRESMNDDSPIRPTSPTRDEIRSPALARLQNTVDSSSSPSTPSNPLDRTPTYLKRTTMPSPIIATPLSPNTTGVSVEADSPIPSSSPQRIHLPSYTHSLASSSVRSTSPTRTENDPSPVRRNTFDFSTLKRSSSVQESDKSGMVSSLTSRYESPSPSRTDFNNVPQSPTPTGVQRRPTSLYHRPSNSLDRFNQPASSTIGDSSSTTPLSPTSTGNSSPMFPKPYRSSYLNDKLSKYGQHLTAGRRLGNHLPRIASGDREDEVQETRKQELKREEKQEEKDTPMKRAERRAARLKAINEEAFGRSYPQDSASSTNPGDVAGVPGRLRLSRDKAPAAATAASPLPSSRLTRGLWADTQRHLIQAYEYLCHVGEAQQWIEGCLGEELGFGVVEMEDELRNGVVLAKLVRVFQGENSVKRIYDAPKLDFRHSDNINIFFTFVRRVGLPECFIFELTDLYEKKNFPKVVYCIHALSHLLARRGLAERIGNLLGRLKFSDDQLQKTQKGLKDAGVAMPNFGNVGRELAKEINEEPEVEVETEDEKRDRLLLENEASIVALQTIARGALARRSQTILRARLRLGERNLLKVQAHCRGFLTRRILEQKRQAQTDLKPWTLALQATSRAVLARRRWNSCLMQIQRSEISYVKLQAQVRGVLQRRRFQKLRAALRTSKVSFTKLQSLARAKLVRQSHKELSRTFVDPMVASSVAAFQGLCRGALARRRAKQRAILLDRLSPYYVALQAHCRGVLVRRQMRKQMAKLEDVSHTVVRIQAAVRTYLARKRLLTLIRGLRRATPFVVNFQARARANIARQNHQNLVKALSEVKTVKAVGTMQSFARAFLARNKHQELARKLDFVAPDVVGLQAAARGVLARDLYYAWRDHLHRNEHVATLLQAMLRGIAQRRKFRAKMEYYRANLSKVVKIQSLFRAKETREQYRQLTMGKNVSVGTIKNFVHLLDDSEADFQEEVKVERLRKRVVEGIRENQSLENDLNDLDVKIALVVQNVKSFEEVIKARRKHGADNAAARAARASLLAAHGDPFSGPNTLDQVARRKLELYQQLFYLLQTRSEYLSRLFVRLYTNDALEKNKRFAERVVLTLFGYGQDRREDYLLLKLFSSAIHDEVNSAQSINDIVDGHPMYMNIAVHYVRPKQIAYALDVFQKLIREIVEHDDLDMEVDPTIIHRKRIELEEMRTGRQSAEPKDVDFRQALDNPSSRPIYIRHLQTLQAWAAVFMKVIMESTRKMPYGTRYLARETLNALREKFPDAPEEAYAACIGRLVYYRYINPIIVTPETFDLVSRTVDVDSRKNLSQISKVLTQITSGIEFSSEAANLIPINEFVKRAIPEFTRWLLDVANVPDAESQFDAHEFLDATVQPKPIYISPNEIYSMHGLLEQYINDVAPARSDDALRIILGELDGVPHIGSEELRNARDTAITLELTNRFANVEDPQAEEKTTWVQAKRGVLAILRVQPAQDLLQALLRNVTEEDELTWDEIVEAELENEARQMPRRQPSTTGPELRLEDIRVLPFSQVKAQAIASVLKLEKMGKITRDDNFQGLLNAIAMDVRSKHRKRLQRQQEMQSMNDALRHLAERKKHFEEQIDSYHNYVEAAMNTMQRGKGSKKRFVLPFTKQYFHLRDLQKSGQTPQFGSFLYTAKHLYEKGILLSIDQYSPRQFDKLQITMSSNAAGVFTITLESVLLGGIAQRIASEDIRMEDLLQAKYEQRSSLSLFKGQMKLNFELFLYQINKKFYV